MLDHLEDNIRRVIADIRSQMLEKVIENWTSRLDYIRASRGSPMPEIIFKIVPPCRKGTIHLQTSIPSPGFEPRPYSKAVSFTNHYTGWAVPWGLSQEV
ncbi:hypothetical protein TNCV_2897431 [Trichonephila clavipes]|nr:hypothetical protein TNCV_2897431 [Trichonephila clavipes]